MSTHTAKHSTSEKTRSRKRAARVEASRHGRSDTGEAFLRDSTRGYAGTHSHEPVAELLGEHYVLSATSGEETFPDQFDEAKKETAGAITAAFSEASPTDEEDIDGAGPITERNPVPYFDSVEPS